MNNEKKKKVDIEELTQNVKEESVDTVGVRSNSTRLYFGYNTRAVLCTVTILVFFGLTAYFLPKAFNFSNSKEITYQENSNLDYKVYLKDNDFYDTDYLEKDKVYIASLIDKILIDFDYSFNIDEKSDIDFNYDIIAKLTINDEVTQNNYFEKEYVLSSNNKTNVVNDTSYKLSEQVSIDYNYYNSLANKFKQSYGVDTTSDLTVYLKVNKANNENENSTSSDSTMFIKIPLSQKAVNIEINYQEINDSSYITKEKNGIIEIVFYAVISVICLIITLVAVVKFIRLLSLSQGKKSIYDKYVGRILNDYDRLIVENSTGPDLKNNNVIKIIKFEELLDTRDNLKLPIMYYNVSSHNKCHFYIKHDNDLYLMTVKAVDLEGNNEKK